MLPWPSRRAAGVAALVLVAAACKRASPEAVAEREPPAPPAASAPPPAAPASVSAAPPPRASASAGPAPLSPAEKALADAYLKALGRGRRATRAKDHPAAVAAFDEALAKRPGDATALSERGYAKLLAGDHAAARKDLDAALRAAGSPELVAQIYHNIGLCEDAAGNAVIGDDFEDRAKKLRAQIKRSGGGAEVCPATVSRPKTAGDVVASWKDAWKRMRDHYKTRENAPYPGKPGEGATDEEIRYEITGALEPDRGAWLYDMKNDENGSGVWHAVGHAPDGKLVLFLAVAEHAIGRCTYGAQAARIEADGGPRVVVEHVDDAYGLMCQKKDDTHSPCTGEEGETPVQSFCGAGTYKIETMLLDFAARTIPLVVEESGPDDESKARPRVTVVPQGDGVMLVGAGCRGKEPLSP